MQDQLRLRHAELTAEYQAGEARLRELVQQESVLRETLLRISGAVQVLQELLDASPDQSSAPADDHLPPSPRLGHDADADVLTVG